MSLTKVLSKFSKDISHTVCICSFNSPVGKITAAADEDFLYLISFEDSKNLEQKLQIIAKKLPCRFVEEKNKFMLKLESELDKYFAGKLKKFTSPIKTIGTEFQKEVWQKLQELPYGCTQTYGDLAQAMGRAPSYSRAIGAACGANAHLLIVPCHRIVASGSKGGFSCGVNRKEWLIEHERKHSS